MGISTVAVLVAAGWFAVRLAEADALFREQTPESVARASYLMPRNTGYLAFQALQMEYGGEDSTPLLTRIASLTPLASAPRIRLGLAAELQGDSSGAQTWLLEAARVDHQFEPRWTLANYYFRRADRDEFWKWMRLALEVSYGDRTPAFDLCWRMSEDSREIFTRAMPDRHDVMAAYLSYLLTEHRLTAAPPVALRVAAINDPNDRLLLLAACDAFLDAQDAVSARVLWRAMGYTLPSGVYSGSFEPPRVGHGFDWRLVDEPGVTHIALDGPPGHRIAFSGQQPESCDLLRQIVSLQPGARYRLRWEARTQGLAFPSGVAWSIAGQQTPIPASENWRADELSFLAPSGLPTLTMTYQRPPGQPRAEGYIDVRGVSVTEAK